MTADPAAAATTPAAQAVDEYRSVSKWVASVFGAFGVLLVGAVPLAKLSDSSPDRHTQLVAGVGAGVVGALVVVVSIMWTLLPRAVYPGTVKGEEHNWIECQLIGAARLEDFLHHHPDRLLPAGVSSMPALDVAIANLEQLVVIQRRAATDKALTAIADRTETTLRDYRTTRARIYALARYEIAHTRHRVAMLFSIIGAFVVVASFVAVTWAIIAPTSKPDAPKPTDAEQVTIVLTKEGRSELTGVLGPDCVKQPINATLIGGSRTESPWDVVIAPSSKCTVSRFVLTETFGTLR